MLEGNVPLFNESIDLSDPAGSAKTFAGMVLGVIAAIAAIAIGRELLHFGANQSDAVSEDTLEVV